MSIILRVRTSPNEGRPIMEAVLTLKAEDDKDVSLSLYEDGWLAVTNPIEGGTSSNFYKLTKEELKALSQKLATLAEFA
jgi:hypothetical protein